MAHGNMIYPLHLHPMFTPMFEEKMKGDISTAQL